MSPLNAGLLVALGLIPSFVWMSFFYRRDCHPEPKYLVTKTFLMGIIISPFAVLLQLGFTHMNQWISVDYFNPNSSMFFLWAAFVEEVVKFYAVRLIAFKDPAFDEPVDAIVYMMMAGLGFAAIENILVLFRTIPDGINSAMTIWSLRFVGATLLHALSSGLLGYFLALSWFSRKHAKKFIFLGLGVATLFHFAFNAFLASSMNQYHGLVWATGLLLIMSFLVYILFDKIRDRSPKSSIHLSPAIEKEINTA